MDDSEGSEGSIHELLLKDKELSNDKEEETEVIETEESGYPGLDKFEDKEDITVDKSWYTEEDMSEGDKNSIKRSGTQNS